MKSYACGSRAFNHTACSTEKIFESSDAPWKGGVPANKHSNGGSLLAPAGQEWNDHQFSGSNRAGADFKEPLVFLRPVHP